MYIKAFTDNLLLSGNHDLEEKDLSINLLKIVEDFELEM